MSEELVASTGFKSASQILADIDNGFGMNPEGTTLGPFGVFIIDQSMTDSTTSVQPLGSDTEPLLEDIPMLDDFTRLLEEQAAFEEAGFPRFDLTDLEPESMMDFSELLLNDKEPNVNAISTPFLYDSPTCNFGSILPKDAAFLLAYYKEKVVPLFSPALRKKSLPWDSLHLRFAKEALASLVMGVECNSAQQTILSALLSSASYHLAATQDKSETAEELVSGADKHRANAFSSLKQTLQKVVLVAKQAKYKEVLTALLSVMDIGVCPPFIFGPHQF